jgi:hypothetical protein
MGASEGCRVAYLGIGVLLFVVWLVLLALARANEAFCVSYRRGRALVVRGSIPQDHRQALVEGLGHPQADNALVKGFVVEDELKLSVNGVEDEQARRLQSALERLPLPALSKSADQPWWRRVGFVWLAWWMDGRDSEPPDEPPEEGPKKSNIVPFRR